MTFKKIKAGGDDSSGLSYAEMREALGDRLMERVCKTLGGLDIEVPTTAMTATHVIVKAMGPEDGEAFRREFSGIRVSVPREPREDKKMAVLACVQAGMTRNEIAQRLAISTRYVRTYLSRLREQGYTISSYNPQRPRGTVSKNGALDARLLSLDAQAIGAMDALMRRYRPRVNRPEIIRKLRVSPAEFRHLLRRFEETGTILPAHAGYAVSPAVSNRGLTGLADVSGAPPHATHQNAPVGA